MAIELKHLRLLQAVDEHGSISGAARHLGYSQAALTQQVQALERSVGTPVLLRNPRGVTLTEAGRVLVRHGDAVLRQIALAQTEVEAVAGLRVGHLRVSAFPSAAGALLPEVFASLKQDHPGLSFEMVEANPQRALELLRHGDCDLAIVYWHLTAGRAHDAPETLDGEVVTPLFDERVDIALPATHRLASRGAVQLGELAEDLWIAGCPLCRGNLMQMCQVAGFTPRIGFETDDYLALRRLASLGLGVALVPELMHTVLPEDELVVFRDLQPQSFRRVGAISTGPLLQLPAVGAALEALRAVSAERELTIQADEV